MSINIYQIFLIILLIIYFKITIKKSFWTFAAGAKTYEYVFYVPTGTIARDVSIG